MKWKYPPAIKVYEALGAIADGRVAVAGTTAKVYSSSGNKFYTVTYDPEKRQIMVNDNASYFKGYLGYPAIAYLMLTREIAYRPEIGELLKGIKWKDINQRVKNDFDKTLEIILSEKSAEEAAELKAEVDAIDARIKELDLSLLGTRVKPPEGY